MVSDHEQPLIHVKVSYLFGQEPLNLFYTSYHGNLQYEVCHKHVCMKETMESTVYFP